MKRRGSRSERGEELPIFALDLAKGRFRISRQVHLVNHHHDLPDAEQTQQISVSPTLLAHAFVRRDDEDGRVRARRAGDHVLEEFLVPRRVDDDVLPLRRAKRNLRRVDRDVLRLLFEQRIEQKGIFELHPSAAQAC